MIKRIALFALIAVQLAVPAWMIGAQEKVLIHGELYRFKTAPVDPYDVFRGRYVALNTDQTSAPIEDGETIRKGENVYLKLEHGPQGFARVVSASSQKPEVGDYIKTRARYTAANTIHFTLPFNRYYMNEKKAPEAERLYRRRSRESQDAYIDVRVLNGTALIEELYVGGKPIGEHF